MNKLVAGISTLVGTVIGAGVLAIPYVVQKSGITIGLIHLIGLGLVMLFLHLLLADITLKIPGKHQLSGYAGKLLGIPGKMLMTMALAFGIYGALAAYILGILASINALGFAPSIWPVFALLALLLLVNLEFFEKAELGLSTGKIFFVLIIILLGFLSPSFSLEISIPDWSLIFIPYGVVFFSYLGTVAIPELREEIGNNKKLLRKAIIIGSIIPILIYTLFAFSVIGLGGVSEVATVSIGQHLGTAGLRFVNAFAILALTSAFIAIGFGLKKMYEYDYGFSKASSWLAVVLPVGLLLVYSHSFVSVLEITGAVAGGLTGILVLLMHKKVVPKGVNQLLYWLLMLLFLLGAFSYFF